FMGSLKEFPVSGRSLFEGEGKLSFPVSEAVFLLDVTFTHELPFDDLVLMGDRELHELLDFQVIGARAGVPQNTVPGEGILNEHHSRVSRDHGHESLPPFRNGVSIGLANLSRPLKEQARPGRPRILGENHSTVAVVAKPLSPLRSYRSAPKLHPGGVVLVRGDPAGVLAGFSPADRPPQSAGVHRAEALRLPLRKLGDIIQYLADIGFKGFA